MKPTYIRGIDIAKHKVRVALRGAAQERFLLEKDLPVSAAGHLMRILTRRLVAVLRSQQPYRSNYNTTLQNAA